MANTEVSDGVREVRLEQGTIRYHDEGEGPTLLFVAGLLANGTLWRNVVSGLSGRFRCVVPDLPLGGHAVPMQPNADLSPRGIARTLANFMEALDLQDVTLVGNDTGGAICQIVIANHPERLDRLVLTNCDAYEAFLPLIISPFHYGPRFFGEHFNSALARLLKYRPAQRLLLWTLTKRRFDEATLDAYFSSFLRDAGVRRDATRFMATISNRYTLEAAKSFPYFERPVLLVWGEDDLFFLKKYARRLQRDFPEARLEFVSGSRAFVPEDQPEELASRIAEFVQTPR